MTALLALAALVVVQTLVAVIYRLAQRDGGYPFAPLSALAMAELGKLAISAALHARACRATDEAPTAFFGRPTFRAHAPKIAVLAVLYFVNNQLAFKLFLWADPTSINLIKSSAIAISALLWTVFFQRPIGPLHWATIAVQMCGMAIVQYDQCAQHTLLALPVYGALFVAVFITALCGVWNELQLKSLPLTLHEQNMALYAVGFALNLGGYVVQRVADPAYPGFFQGYWGIGIVVILLNAVIGIVVTAVYKYADALVKTLASAITTIAVLFVSAALFHSPLTVSIVLGSTVVVLATAMYLNLPAGSNAEKGTAPLAEAGPAHVHTSLPRKSARIVAALAVGALVLLAATHTDGPAWGRSTPTPATRPDDRVAQAPVPASDAGVLCIHMTHQPDAATAARVVPFLDSCRANGIRCSSGQDASIEATFIYHGYVRRPVPNAAPESLALGCIDGNRGYEAVYEFAVDLKDNSAFIYQPLAESVAAYFKTSRSTELMERLDPKLISDNDGGPVVVRRHGQAFMEARQADYRMVRDRLYPIPLRKVAPPGPNPELASYKRRVVLATMSFHVASVEMAPERQRLYEALRAIAPSWQDVDMHVIDGGNRSHSSTPVLHQSPRLGDGKDPRNDRDYFRFVGESHFLLNLPGIWASQPYRLYDACYADTAVASTHIYADNALAFPHYPLRGADPVRAYLNTTLLEAEVRFLVQHHEAIFADLIVAQRDWCKNNIGDVAYIHHILRKIPGQPFGPTLRDLDVDVYRHFY